MRRHALLIAMAATTLAAASCDTFTGLFSEDTIRPGILEWTSGADTDSSMAAALDITNDPDEIGVPRLEAPDTVAVGEVFTVEVTTWEDACMRKHHTDVANDSLEARVEPYNYIPSQDPDDLTYTCPDVLKEIIHAADLRFTAAGTALLEVTGWRVTDGEVEEAETMTLEKTIHVR